MDPTNALFLLTSVLLLTGAITDLLWLKIPNVLVGLLLLTFIAAVLITDREISLVFLIFPGVFLLIGGAVMFYFGMLGGGDAKFLAVAGLFVGFELMASFMLWLALWGAAVALFFIFARDPLQWAFASLSDMLGRKLFLPHAISEQGSVPYGVAITAAVLTVLPQTPFFV